MWSKGLKKLLSEILSKFEGEVSYAWKNGTFLIKEGNKNIDEIENVFVQLTKGENTYQETLTFDEMYQILVPDNKSLELFYMLQDVLFELEQEDSKEYVVRSYLNQAVVKIASVFAQRTNDMELVGETKVEKKNDICQLVSGFRFKQDGVDYEQLALF